MCSSTPLLRCGSWQRRLAVPRTWLSLHRPVRGSTPQTLGQKEQPGGVSNGGAEFCRREYQMVGASGKCCQALLKAGLQSLLYRFPPGGGVVLSHFVKPISRHVQSMWCKVL